MKKYQSTIAAAILALASTNHSAQANLVTDATGTGNFVFGNPASSTITVGYDVVFDSSTALYTYLYSFTPIAGDNIGQFTINAKYVNSVLAAGTIFTGSPYTLTGAITDNGTSLGNVSWVWSPYTAAEQFVGFTSFFGPTPGAGSLNDDTTGPWGDNPGSTGTPITVPLGAVPEPSTALAGILVLLPFSAGLIRCFRKLRPAKGA